MKPKSKESKMFTSYSNVLDFVRVGHIKNNSTFSYGPVSYKKLRTRKGLVIVQNLTSGLEETFNPTCIVSDVRQA